MDLFFNTLRKVLVGFVATVFAFAVVYVPQPPKPAHALGGAVTIIGGPGSIAAVIAAAAATVQAKKETVLDQIGFLIAKTMISQMLQSMITWINSGFQGSPAFIQDLDRFLLGVADEVAGEFIQQLGDVGSFICSPFRLDIQLALAIKYQKARERRNVDSCTLSGVVDNIENFFDSQVSSDNFWEQWIEVTSKPQTYTPYGQFIAAEAELNARIVNARGQELQIANWGNGFLSNEICEAIEGPNGENRRCVISTPGKVIAEQLNNALDSGREQLVAADEINEVISALLGQIANQALTGAAGLLGLSTGSGYTSGGYGSGSYVDELATQSSSNASSYITRNFEDSKEKLEVQKEYSALALEYIPQLQAVISEPTSALRFRGLSETEIRDLKDRAEIALEDAQEVRDNTAAHIRVLEPLITEFEALERERTATTPAVSRERAQAIATRQAEIISRTAGYSAYTLDRLRVSKREWSTITRS